MTLSKMAVPAAPPGRRLRDRVLVVTEDPSFIRRVRLVAEAEGATVTACLGPAASPCLLDENESCALASRCRVVIVESPPGGNFRYHLKDVSAGAYAECLQRAHPGSYVMFIPSLAELSGPTGEVAVVNDRGESVHLLKWILRSLRISKDAPERSKR